MGALVPFNRFSQPTVDPETREVWPNALLNAPHELRLSVRWIGLLYGHIAANLAATRGVHYAVPVLTDEQAAYYTQLDGVDRYARVARDPTQPGEIIGVVRADRDPGTAQAGYAIVVEDRGQGCGWGRGLTRRWCRTLAELFTQYSPRYTAMFTGGLHNGWVNDEF